MQGVPKGYWHRSGVLAWLLRDFQRNPSRPRAPLSEASWRAFAISWPIDFGAMPCPLDEGRVACPVSTPLSTGRRCLCVRERRRYMGRRNGPRGDQSFAPRIHSEIQPFKGARTEQALVSLLSKHDLVDGKRFGDAHDGKANASRNGLAVRHQERYVLLLALDANLLEKSGGDPSVLAASVHESSRNRCAPRSPGYVLDADQRAKCAHRVAM